MLLFFLNFFHGFVQFLLFLIAQLFLFAELFFHRFLQLFLLLILFGFGKTLLFIDF